jgi:hypothetical protein
MNGLTRSLAIPLMLCLTTAARAYDPAPVSDPESLGFSSSRLDRIPDMLCLTESDGTGPKLSLQFT